MKISIFDGVNKFTQPLIEDWQAKGHEIKKDKSWDPRLVSWADVTFFEFCDISIQRASDPGDSFYQNPEFGVQPQNKKIICRIHDIEAWVGNHGRVNWNWVNHVIFIAEHIQNKVLSEIQLPSTTKVHLIKHGLDTSKWTFKERWHGNKIAIIGNINHQKNFPLALQVLADNPTYELHVVGKGLDSWNRYYVENFIKRNNLKVFFYDWVESLDEFLEDKNYLLLTSMKEAFSFVVGEACAKGIRPLIHAFPDAHNIWPKEWIWEKVSDASDMLQRFYEYDSYRYREYVEEHYPVQKMLEQYNELLLNK